MFRDKIARWASPDEIPQPPIEVEILAELNSAVSEESRILMGFVSGVPRGPECHLQNKIIQILGKVRWIHPTVC